MRIKIVLPVPHNMWNDQILASCKEAASQKAEIELVNTQHGAETLEGFYHASFAERDTINEIIQAEKDGYDVVVVWCTANVGVEAAREVVKIPVVGIMEAAHLLAMLLGRRFSELVSVKNVVVRHERNAEILGSNSKLASVREIALPVKKFHENLDLTYKKMFEAGKKAIDEDNADVLVLGCGAMLGITDKLSKELGVPVIEPGSAGVQMAEMLVHLHKAHSKKAYPLPLDDIKVIK